ncbi:MAG: flavodoxin family protein [Candidatus Gastranaerophilaceae bacterium]
MSIIYHSIRNHTQKQAESVLAGLQEYPEIEAKIISVENWQEQSDFINDSKAIIFGSPTFMGSISAQFKTFMDSTSKIWFKQQWKDKLAAGFINSGWPSGDKLNSMNQLVIFAAQHGMVWVSLGLIPGDLSREENKKDINRLGSFLGAMSCSPFSESCETSPPECDRMTAKLLGKRMAESVLRWNKGGNATL